MYPKMVAFKYINTFQNISKNNCTFRCKKYYVNHMVKSQLIHFSSSCKTAQSTVKTEIIPVVLTYNPINKTVALIILKNNSESS